jgi:hypothetical protein
MASTFAGNAEERFAIGWCDAERYLVLDDSPIAIATETVELAAGDEGTSATCSPCSPTGPSPEASSPPTSSRPSSKTKLSGASRKIRSDALFWPSLADPLIAGTFYAVAVMRVRTRLPERIRTFVQENTVALEPERDALSARTTRGIRRRYSAGSERRTPYAYASSARPRRSV